MLSGANTECWCDGRTLASSRTITYAMRCWQWVMQHVSAGQQSEQSVRQNSISPLRIAGNDSSGPHETVHCDVENCTEVW